MVKPCARCHRPMHPTQNSRRMPDGIICMGCYEGPRILYYDSNHNRLVLVENASGGTVRMSAHGSRPDDPRLN